MWPSAGCAVPQLRAECCDLLQGALLQFQQLWNLGPESLSVHTLKKVTVQPIISCCRMVPFTQGSKYPGLPPPPTGHIVQLMFLWNLKEAEPAAPQQSYFKVESYILEEHTSISGRMLGYFSKQQPTSLYRREIYFLNVTNPKKSGSCELEWMTRLDRPGTYMSLLYTPIWLT